MAVLADLPRKAVTRTARLAGLPLGYAGRTAVGMGNRLGGAPAEAVLTEPVLSALYDTPVEVARHDDRPLVLHHHWNDQLGTPFPEAPDATRTTVH